VKPLTEKLLKELKDGPGTASELASILLPRRPHREALRICSATLCNLRRYGKVKVIGHVDRTGPIKGKVVSNLFALK
jgi:hypothetical protein